MKTRERLSKGRIVAAAMEMIDKEGEKAFSMRKLATVLNVDPMAIYHHHANKSALLHAVIQAMMQECEVPVSRGNWQEDVRALCQGLRQLAGKHPGVFRIYETYEHWVPAEHRLHEAYHATLLNAGLPRVSVVRAVRVLLAYTEAFAVDEITGWLDPEDREVLTKTLAGGSYPAMTNLIDELSETNTDEDFDFGLDVLISGLEAEIAKATG